MDFGPQEKKTQEPFPLKHIEMSHGEPIGAFRMVCDFSQGPIVHVASSSVSAVSAVGETLRVGTLGMASCEARSVWQDPLDFVFSCFF